jgi:hypothetical protein
MTEEYFCIPIAGVLGFFGGIINEFIRMRGDYLPLAFGKPIDDPFNQEI